MHLDPFGPALFVDVHLMVVGADGNLCRKDERGVGSWRMHVFSGSLPPS